MSDCEDVRVAEQFSTSNLVMTKQPKRPEDVLPDQDNYKMLDGVQVRKGTIYAAMQNMELLEEGAEKERQGALKAIQDLAPSLVVLGVHRHFMCRNPEVEILLKEAAEELRHRRGAT